MMDDSILQVFLDESHEHLSNIEQELLNVEQMGEKVDLSLVNKLFRALHSVKGGAGFMGLRKIQHLSHAMENVLNVMREGNLIPDSKIISTLLSSSDLLRTMLDNYTTSENEDISKCLTNLKLILEPDQGSQQKITNTEIDYIIDIKINNKDLIFSISEKTLSYSMIGNKHLYLLSFCTGIEENEQKEHSMEIAKELEGVGTIIESTVIKGKDKNDAKIYMLFATVIDPDNISLLIEVDEEKIILITEQKLLENRRKESIKDDSITEVVRNESKQNLHQQVIENTLRVNISMLDKLMNLAGELVLTRNQLGQAVIIKNFSKIEQASREIDFITSELQASVMATRMQPIGKILNKFKRIIRDMSNKLGKRINLSIEGDGVELDKTIIEHIGDPLTHLVRNSVDHGIEMPKERLNSGKESTAQVMLRVYHEAGKVVIEVSDDGRGIDHNIIKRKAVAKGLFSSQVLEKKTKQDLVNLIFEPGFSTADKISDISGRGVGMDVVKTNINRLGGTIEIATTVGKGTDFIIKLPLTLAIILSVLVSTNGRRFAIPQVNIVELVRVPALQIQERIKFIGETIVLNLRGELLPLISLWEVLGESKKSYFNPVTKANRPERRQRIVDRRNSEKELPKKIEEKRQNEDRRLQAASAYHIVVVNAGDFHYGLIVDSLVDSEEIVVKPLGSHLKDLEIYAGATILGDGHVAMILDVVGISGFMKIQNTKGAISNDAEEESSNENIHSFLIANNGEDEQFAIPLSLVERIEKINTCEIEITGGVRNIQYRSRNLPLFSIEDVVDIKDIAKREKCFVIISIVAEHEVGFLVSHVVDVVDIDVIIDEATFTQKGVKGSFIMEEKTTLLLDVEGIVKEITPSWFESLSRE